MGSEGLHKLSATVLNQNPEDQAIEFEKQWYTWGDLRRIAGMVTELIAACGAAPDTKIVLVAKNRPSAIAAYLGLMEKRFTFRLVYPFQSSTSMAREIEQINPSVVIAADETFNSEITKALKSAGIAGIALSQRGAKQVPGLERSLNPTTGYPAPFIEIHTSGTTGAPKPFEFDYETIAKHIVGGRRTPSSEGDNPRALPPILMYFPTGNITGLHATIAPLLRGQRGVLLDRFNIEGWHDHLKRYQPPAGGLPPAGVQMVLDADLPREDFACLKMIGSGSAPLDPGVQSAFEARYGVPILLAYGATEFGGPVAGMSPEMYAEWGSRKTGSVGKPYPGARFRVIDAESNEELPPGETGILEVVSPRMGTHWIRTSDIGYVDEDGFIFLCGRADGAIMRGGFKVLPETIETALLLHSAVSAAGVIGIPDHRLGQVPAAAIELKAGATTPSFEELEQHLREHIAATHIPVKWKFVSELPRTASYKVHQPTLRSLFE
ncbi:class I adenylate-forming enzyme family protein [Ketobacter sp.]|nr:MAG: AMP-dependent synthetase [Ketobacter sp.]